MPFMRSGRDGRASQRAFINTLAADPAKGLFGVPVNRQEAALRDIGRGCRLEAPTAQFFVQRARVRCVFVLHGGDISAFDDMFST